MSTLVERLEGLARTLENGHRPANAAMVVREAAAALRATGEGEWPDDTTHLFSDAMDDAVSAFMAVKHGITRNAENSGETADPERVIRRSLIAAMKTYRETYLRDNPPAAPTPAEPTDPDDMEHDWSNIRRGAINPKTPAEPTNPGEISSKVVEPLRDAGAVATDEMVTAYLTAQRAAIAEYHSKWNQSPHQDDIREACRRGLNAALAAHPAPQQPDEGAVERLVEHLRDKMFYRSMAPATLVMVAREYLAAAAQEVE